MDMVLRSRPFGRRADAGMTLIEVLVATTVLGLALLALAPMFTRSSRSSRDIHGATRG
jgi:prepilin-type N-terminal cleavage/methylation domain-containing protein